MQMNSKNKKEVEIKTNIRKYTQAKMIQEERDFSTRIPKYFHFRS